MEKKSSEDSSQANENSLLKDLKLLFDKHFSTKFKPFPIKFKGVNLLSDKKKFRRLLIPAFAIGLILNANVNRDSEGISKRYPSRWEAEQACKTWKSKIEKKLK